MTLPVTILTDGVYDGQALFGWFPYVSIMITYIYNIVTVVPHTRQGIGEAEG